SASHYNRQAMAKKAIVFSCVECGAQSPKWLGRCPECHTWSSFEEEKPAASASASLSLASSSEPVPIDSVRAESNSRISTEIADFDRVLGGGIVPGSMILVGGKPGVGKSTLLLQAAENLARLGTVLYVSGEASPRQIALRARRLGTMNHGI